MKLVSENSENDLKRRETSDRLRNVLQHFAANFLRILAGAGKPDELPGDVAALGSAIYDFTEAHGRSPCAELRTALDREEAFLNNRPWVRDSRKNAEVSIIESDIDYGRELIVSNAMRYVAAIFADQLTQMNVARHKIFEGINLIEEARSKRREKHQRFSGIKRSKKKT